MTRLMIVVLIGLLSAGCLAEADEPAPEGTAGSDDDGRAALPSSDNDSDMDDGSAWPKWKNPCPGPACDPPHERQQWVVDPPPDRPYIAPLLQRQPQEI